MQMTLEPVCQATQRSLIGLIALVMSCACGLTYLATVLLPALLRRDALLQNLDQSNILLFVIIGSGVAFLLALLSFGLERPMWPGITALPVLTVTELPVILVMPFWVLMLLGSWSAWAVVSYLAAFIAALLLIRRAVTGRVPIKNPVRFGRCPLMARLRTQ